VTAMEESTTVTTGCIKMIGAVSIWHYGFEHACRSKFPTWNKTGVFKFCANAQSRDHT
jgi:hypothetical protein